MHAPEPRSKTPLIELKDVTKVYRTGGQEVRALDGVSLTIRHGEFVAIMGQSGSGKSTLMNILGCLDRPSSGSYEVSGTNVATLTGDELAALRRDTFGFVFQRYNLLSTMTATENVELPAIYAGTTRSERFERARALLARLGMGDRAAHRPGELSGGQQQRVSIARALMNGADVILADEPTGALDTQSGADVLKVLKDLNAEGHTIILITHDAEVARLIFDPAVITVDEILEVFWQTHDPTTLNRQGADVGTQYRSAIFYHSPEQQRIAEHYKAELNASGAFRGPIVTEIVPAVTFYPAEDYHQNYYAQNGEEGYCQMVIRPKVDKFRKAFATKLKP